MENKLLQTKDSLLIGNTKYKEEIYEKARLRYSLFSIFYK